MGVTGLWRLIEPAGKPVPVETLENKVLAVDVSIWLHQMVKGYQDAKGAPLPNAHLMGLFQRLCKLLYFRIKPVFVFDGGFPDLKRETIAKRQDHKAKYNSESERIKRELALLLSKKTAVSSLLGKQISPKQSTNPSSNDDLFKLPALPQREESESESEDEDTSSGSIVDLHSVDIESDSFKKMAVKEKYDLLIELKETRKMNSWGKLHELPKKSDSFSDFQMQRLLKRRKVQECLEETEKEMGDSGMSLNELESLLNEEGIDTKIQSLPTRRIASNEATRFLLIKDVKQALADAKMRQEAQNKPEVSKVEEIVEGEAKPAKVDELEDDLQKAIKMSLECVDDPNDTATTSKTDDSWISCMTDSDNSYSYDSEEEDGFEQPDNMSTAKAYIMQYSDFTHKAIDKLVTNNRNTNKDKNKLPKVDEILEEINKEKSVIVDNVNLSSDDDCNNEKVKLLQSNYVNSSNEDSESPCKNTLDATQSSVVCIENTTTDVITLDTSTEYSENETKECSFVSNIKHESDSSELEFEEISDKDEVISTSIKMSNTDNSDSSDNEFEDVPDEENKPFKPVVELTLNMGDAPGEDDIFADVFNEPKETVSKHLKEVNINSENTNIGMVSESTKDIVQKPNKTVIKDASDIEVATLKTNIKVVDTLKETSRPQQMPIIDKHDDTIAKTESANNLAIERQKDTIENLQAQNSEPTNQPKNSTTTDVSNVHKQMTTEKLNSLVEEIQNEEQDLIQEKGRLDRVGRNITEQMTKEAQELLQIFGIPYIVSPMEAEAQCAFLENANLTDGTITDDSDIWLFGGRTVYKNFFNQKKHVLQFLADRIEKSFNLNREQLVLLALLVGSDYTTGVTGVGPVTALEILASFPFKRQRNETSKHERYTQIVKGLQEFKQWVRAGKRTDNTSLKKKLKNVALTDEFPSVRVVQAYLDPNVEKSEDKFTWGELDITILRDYTKAKFGWSQNKLDEIIKPILKRMRDRKTQRSVQDFFKRKVDFQSLEDQMSKRVKAAVQRMGPEKPLEEGNVVIEDAPASKRKAGNRNKGSNSKSTAGPFAAKQRKQNETNLLDDQGVKVVSQMKDGKTDFEIKIPKSDRCQEIIPQREKDKQSLFQNKLKAIELFRKTNIDKKKKNVKRKAIQPKEKAELSESDSD